MELGSSMENDVFGGSINEVPMVPSPLLFKGYGTHLNMAQWPPWYDLGDLPASKLVTANSQFIHVSFQCFSTSPSPYLNTPLTLARGSAHLVSSSPMVLSNAKCLILENYGREKRELGLQSTQNTKD
jgi:hypothetical protein